MADIFISYSKADRDKVVLLAAYLEAEGWSVWWDTNLAVGTQYRDEIMRELSAARAVIVLWTKNSVSSDFVRAEAGRAKAHSKLIPVKDADIGYSDIPLPFGEIHTENLSRKELIRAAVVAQLSKPPPGSLWRAGKILRYQMLTSVGIAGGAITVFANLRGLIDLAEWASVLVEHWHRWMEAFWHRAFSWVGIQLPPGWPAVLSYCAFGVATAVGARAYSANTSGPAITAKTALAYVGGMALFAEVILLTYISTSIYAPILGVILLLAPFPVLLVLSRANRLSTLGFLAINLALSVLLMGGLVRGSVSGFATTALMAAVVCMPGVMLSLSSTRALTDRLLLVATALGLLVGLNLFSYHYLVDVKAALYPSTLGDTDAYRYARRAADRQRRGDLHHAIADYTRAIQVRPSYAWALYARGSVYQENKEFDLAIADYTKAIQVQPRYAQAYYARGSAYNEMKNFDKAIADLTSAIEVDVLVVDIDEPGVSPGLYDGKHSTAKGDSLKLRGNIYQALGRLDEAAADFRAAQTFALY
jgi:hypothetical protein